MASTSNSRIAKNSLILYADLIISSVIMIFAARFLLEALGVRDFGLYNVVGGIVVLLNVVNTAMISTSYRYIAFEMGKAESGDPNKVFNTCQAIHLAISIAIVIIGWPIGNYYIQHYLNVDGSTIGDAKFVFVFSVCTCAISTFTVPYLGLITAKERFSIKAGINILRNLIRLCLIVLLLNISGNHICIYAVFAFIPELLVAILYVVYCQKKYDEITKWKWVKDLVLYKEMILFAFWILLGAVARIGKTQGAALIVNFFYGTVLNAALAVANQVNGFVSLATNSLSQAAVPQITKSYSGGDTDRSIQLVVYISKYTFIMMLLVCTPLLMQTQWLLDLWLNDVPQYTRSFVQLVLLDAMITCLGAGIPALYQATGKIRIFQISLSVILLSSILFGYFAYKWNFGPNSLLIIYCIMSFVDRIVAVILLKVVLHLDLKPLLKFSYLNSLKLSIFLIPLYWINLSLTGPILSPVMIVVSEFLMILLVFVAGLSRHEKEIAVGFAKSAIRKLI